MPHETLPDKIRRAESQLEQQVYVLVWGPGKNTRYQQWYEKRVKVADHIRSLNANYDVWTSEDIFEQESTMPRSDFSDLDQGTRELLQAKNADLIFALVLGPPEKQPGIYRELEIISPVRSLRDKTYIFLPDQPSYRQRFASGVINKFRGDHIFPLPWAALKECSLLRGLCGSLVSEELKQKLIGVLHSSII